MTVQNSVIGSIKPGRYEDFLSQGLEVTKLFERHGVSDTRLLLANAAGELQGRFVFTSEHSDPEQYGAFTDELLQDGEMQSLLLRLQSPDNPVVIEQQTVAVEVDLGRKKRKKGAAAPRGSIIEAHATQVRPGGLERSIRQAAQACDLMERAGARNPRLFQQLFAGSASGSYLITWEFENMQAWGRAQSAWMEDPAGQELGADLASADAAVTIVFSGLFSEVPL